MYVEIPTRTMVSQECVMVENASLSYPRLKKRFCIVVLVRILQYIVQARKDIPLRMPYFMSYSSGSGMGIALPDRFAHDTPSSVTPWSSIIMRV